MLIEKLMTIPKSQRPRLLRVYGSMVEHKDFPIPREPIHPKRKESTTESQSNKDLKDIILHYRIRQKDNPMSGKILDFDQRFRHHPEEVSLDEIREYIKTVTAAAMIELEQTDIILCTCVTASAPKFRKCFIKQVSHKK